MGLLVSESSEQAEKMMGGWVDGSEAWYHRLGATERAAKRKDRKAPLSLKLLANYCSSQATGSQPPRLRLGGQAAPAQERMPAAGGWRLAAGCHRLMPGRGAYMRCGSR